MTDAERAAGDDSTPARSTPNDPIAARDDDAAVAPGEAPAQAANDDSASTDDEAAAPPGQGHDGNNESDADDGDEDEDEDEDEEEEEEEEEEPKLKYARLTQHLGAVYRNGDATSSFLVAGDKMILGTHNGNIHVVQLPIFQSLRAYRAHSASVTGISISPYPPPLPNIKAETAARLTSKTSASPLRPSTSSENSSSHAAVSRRPPKDQNAVPNTPSNNIYIATSSMDGNVCVQSLLDMKDVQLRNFARPVQAVALSPEYKTDRMYLSGGLAGQLILTTGAPSGRSTATTTGAAAQAAGWLGGMVGAGTGKDTVLHSGEGTINAIKWSLSGRYVAWLNEHGIKIMRTKLHLESADADDAWKRIGHAERPLGEEWEAMASVWRGRIEWIDEQTVESDGDAKEVAEVVKSPALEKLKQQQLKSNKVIERLLVGWGGTVWIMHVHPGGVGTGKNAGERTAGRADIAKK